MKFGMVEQNTDSVSDGECAHGITAPRGTLAARAQARKDIKGISQNEEGDGR